MYLRSSMGELETMFAFLPVGVVKVENVAIRG
jgi:hypothetical protein